MKIFKAGEPEGKAVILVDLEGREIDAVREAGIDDEGDHNGYFLQYVRTETGRLMHGPPIKSPGRTDFPLVLHLLFTEFDVVDRESGLVIGGHRKMPAQVMELTLEDLNPDERAFHEKVQQLVKEQSND